MPSNDKGTKERSEWTEEQVNFLRNHPDTSMSWLVNNMPGDKHTEGSVQAKRRELDMTNPPVPWTEEQITFLKANKNQNNAWIIKHMPEPKKSRNAINHMRKKLNIQLNNRIPWTKKQDSFLKEHADKPLNWLVDNMPGQKHTKISTRGRFYIINKAELQFRRANK